MQLPNHNVNQVIQTNLQEMQGPQLLQQPTVMQPQQLPGPQMGGPTQALHTNQTPPMMMVSEGMQRQSMVFPSHSSPMPNNIGNTQMIMQRPQMMVTSQGMQMPQMVMTSQGMQATPVMITPQGIQAPPLMMTSQGMKTSTMVMATEGVATPPMIVPAQGMQNMSAPMEKLHYMQICCDMLMSIALYSYYN